MKQITEYIIEKLKINSESGIKHQRYNTRIDDFKDLEINIDDEDIPVEFADIKYPDTRKKRYLGNGKATNWWRWWKILAYNGPTTKPNLNLAIGNSNPTSYSTMYAELARQNIITYNKKLRCLEAQPMSKWNI